MSQRSTSRSGSIREIKTRAEYDAEMATVGLSRLLVIDFFALWCDQCHKIAPAVDKLAYDFRRETSFIRVNVDKLKDLANQYSIKALPTFVVLKVGQEVGRVLGANLEKLQAAIMRNLV